MPTTRRGFTLVELLVAMVCFGLVAAVLMRTLVMTQKVTTAQANRAQMQSNLRVASVLVPNELRMLNQAETTDILDVSDTSITYLAMRGYYMLCADVSATTSVQVARVTNETYSFDYRAPAAGDSAFLFYENDTLKISDDLWARVGITAVATSTCAWPQSGQAAYTFTLNPVIAGTFTLTKFLKGAPLRTYEITRLTLMTSGGNKFLGMCTGLSTCTPEPVVGPLADNGGFVLTRYNDAGGVVTGNTATNRASLRSLRIKFVGKTEQVISRGTDRGALQTVQDSLITVVTLRNVKQN